MGILGKALLEPLGTQLSVGSIALDGKASLRIREAGAGKGSCTHRTGSARGSYLHLPRVRTSGDGIKGVH